MSPSKYWNMILENLENFKNSEQGNTQRNRDEILGHSSFNVQLRKLANKSIWKKREKLQEWGS